MKAWTVATPDMMPCAKECIARLRDFCWMPEVEIVEVGSKSEAHRKKLTHWLTMSGPAWFVDADLWFIAPAWLPAVASPMVVGAPNNSPVESKYTGDGIDFTDHICSCLVGMDASQEVVRSMLLKAVEMQAENPSEDEVFLNKAIFSSQSIIPCRLSTRFNFCHHEPKRTTVAIHAAGQPNKLEWLRSAESFYRCNLDS